MKEQEKIKCVPLLHPPTHRATHCPSSGGVARKGRERGRVKRKKGHEKEEEEEEGEKKNISPMSSDAGDIWFFGPSGRGGHIIRTVLCF